MRQMLFGVVGELSTLPGCSQVVVSHGVFLPEAAREKGLGKLANRERKTMVFDELGYDCMICTVDATNTRQIAVLSDCGWNVLFEFRSSKTGHLVQIWGVKK